MIPNTPAQVVENIFLHTCTHTHTHTEREREREREIEREREQVYAEPNANFDSRRKETLCKCPNTQKTEFWGPIRVSHLYACNSHPRVEFLEREKWSHKGQFDATLKKKENVTVAPDAQWIVQKL